MEFQNTTDKKNNMKQIYIKPQVKVIEVDTSEIMQMLAVSGNTSFEEAESKGFSDFEEWEDDEALTLANFSVWGDEEEEDVY